MANRFSLEAIFKATDRFSAPISRMEKRLESMTKSFAKGLGKVDRVNARVSDGLQRAMVAGAATGVAFGVAANSVVGAGADFEQAITDVGAVSLMTRSQVADLEKQALELGSTTKFSAKEVAAGMELMGRAGFDNAQIMQAMPGVLNAAAAEGAELAEVTGIISNVLKGMGMEADQTTRVADVLALASAKTNSSITSLGESMANASATARQFRVPFEDTVAAVALLQDVGLDASEAGTAVATMLTKLSKPSKDAAAQMAAMGIKFQDAKGDMLPLAEVLGQFQKSADKAGGNMKTAAFFAELVGLRGQKAAINLKDLFTAGKVGKLTEELQNASGKAKEMADLRMDSFRGDVSKLGKAFDALQISIFDMNSKGLRGAVQGMIAWIGANKEFLKTRVQEFIIFIATNLPTIFMWIGRIVATVALFYAWSLAVKAAAVAAEVLGVALEVVAFVTDAQRLATIASTAVLWLSNAALVAYNAVTWLGTAALTAYGIVTGEQTALMVVGNAVRALTAAGAIAYNAIIGVGTALLVVYNTVTSLSAIRQAALTAVLWLAVAAQTALNTSMLANPAFLVGAAIVGLIALVIKLSGGWDFLKGKISGFAAGAMSYIQPVIDKVMAFYNVMKKAASFVGSFGEAATGGTPEGFTRVPTDSFAPLMSPADGVSKSIEESNFVSRGEVTIKDESGKAQITKAPAGGGFGLTLSPSGAF